MKVEDSRGGIVGLLLIVVTGMVATGRL